MADLARLKKKLKKTWGPFFSRFGGINSLQLQVIPSILAGENIIVASPAASGKTEAAFAPLVERLETNQSQLSILYVAPTRALVNNIYYRLKDVLTVSVRVAVGASFSGLATLDFVSFKVRELPLAIKTLDSITGDNKSFWNLKCLS